MNKTGISWTDLTWNPVSVPQMQKPILEQGKKTRCPYCSKQFEKGHAIGAHISKAHKDAVRYCLKCGVLLTDKNWWASSRRNGNHRCKKCDFEYQKKWKEQHPEVVKSRSKKYGLRTRTIINATPQSREKYLQASRDRWARTYPHHREDERFRAIKNNYGISKVEFEQLYNEQKGMCPLCGEFLEEGRKAHSMAVDHNHKTGKIRGIIHKNCNIGLYTIENHPEETIRYFFSTDQDLWRRISEAVKKLEVVT